MSLVEVASSYDIALVPVKKVLSQMRVTSQKMTIYGSICCSYNNNQESKHKNDKKENQSAPKSYRGPRRSP